MIPFTKSSINTIIDLIDLHNRFIWFQETPWGYEKQYIFTYTYTLQYQMEKKLSNKYYE